LVKGAGLELGAKSAYTWRDRLTMIKP